MNARESVGIALDALRANMLRSALTLLGVIIGVASVITVMSMVQGLNRYVSWRVTAATVLRLGLAMAGRGPASCAR